MKLVIHLALLLIGVVGCTGWEQDIVGSVSVKETFTLKGTERSLVFTPGSHRVGVGFEYGSYGISHPKLKISYGGKSYAFSIPKSSFNKEAESVNASAKMIGQTFSISGERTKRVLDSRSEQGTKSCTYCGYCYVTGISTDANGNISSEQGYRNSCSCDGEQDVIYRIKQVELGYQLNFKSLNNVSLASFHGRTEVFEEKTVEKKLTTCN